MSTLIFGANGFIGSHVFEELTRSGESVVKAVRTGDGRGPEKLVDLNDPKAIIATLQAISPRFIVQAAGVTSTDMPEQNQQLTHNLLKAVIDAEVWPKKVIILGSAAEYGVVELDELPVKESTPLRATTPYGLSKIQEEKLALSFRQQGLPVVVARIFNPIGIGMPSRFLVPTVLLQIEEFRKGLRKAIEVNRLDAARDYIHVFDIAKAIHFLIKDDTGFDVYNLGSGHSTTNKDIVNFLIENSKIEPKPEIIEIMKEPEPQYAVCADITRISLELGWKPSITIGRAIKEIVDASQ